MKKLLIKLIIPALVFAAFSNISAKAEDTNVKDLVTGETVIYDSGFPTVTVNESELTGTSCKALICNENLYVSVDSFIQDICDADCVFYPAKGLLTVSEKNDEEKTDISTGTLKFISFGSNSGLFVPADSVFPLFGIEKTNDDKSTVKLSWDLSLKTVKDEENKGFEFDFSGLDLGGEVPVFTENFLISKPKQNGTQTINRKITVSLPVTDIFRVLKSSSYKGPYVEAATVKKSESGKIDIVFELNRVCAYNFSTDNNKISFKFVKPAEKYDKIVVIDPGHGGYDPGAVRGNVYESNINLMIATEKLGKNLEEAGIKVYYTRTTDTFVELQTRPDFANEVEADLFISIHQNTHSNKKVSGVSVYYSKDNNPLYDNGFCSKVYANIIKTNFLSDVKCVNQGIYTTPLSVTKYSKMPAVLVECGFLSNDSEILKLQERQYRDLIADSLSKSIIGIFNDYPGLRNKPEPATSLENQNGKDSGNQ